MSLREHLLAEIERREKTARKAIAGPWGRDDTGQIFAMRPTTMITVHVAEADGNTDAEFIALHDPADALRRYAAARRVLQRHEHHRERVAGERFDVLTGQPLPAEYETTCAVCGWVGTNDDPDSVCPDTRAIAESLGLSAGISSEEGTQP